MSPISVKFLFAPADLVAAENTFAAHCTETSQTGV